MKMDHKLENGQSVGEVIAAEKDAVVLKRLKFIYKIIKALTSQPNNRNRQAHLYVLEVLDTIGDWSGNENTEIVEVLDKQMLPQVCQLVSTLNREEFKVFQQFFAKYVLCKWEEMSNFLVLDFLCEIYGFITSIAPIPVVREYVEVFMQKDMPPHITLIVFPAIVRNLTDKAAAELSEVLPVIDRFCLPFTQENELNLGTVFQFWKSIPSSFKTGGDLSKLSTSIRHCIMSSDYLSLLKEADLENIAQSLDEWSKDTSNTEAFLLIATIFLTTIASSGLNNSNLVQISCSLIDRITINVNKSKSRPICVVVMQVLQKVLEYATVEFKEPIEKLREAYNIDQFEKVTENEDAEVTLQTMESCVKRLLTQSFIDQSEQHRKRIKLMIERLQTEY